VALMRKLKNIFAIPELLWKLLFTLGVLIVYRLGSYIPVIGVNARMLAEYMSRSDASGSLLSYFDAFTGGSLSAATVFALGIGPYITASIMMQMLSMAVPYLEQLNKEGEYGRKLINQYTRYLTIGLSIFYSITYITWLEHMNLILDPGIGFRILFILSLTVGATFVMWLGEQISLMGLGNGSSMIIFAGIVARFPNGILKMAESVVQRDTSLFVALFILCAFAIFTSAIVFLEKGDRKIPVQYPRRVVGQRVYGGQTSYIPFKINPAGVMPVIFAQSVLGFFLFIPRLLADKFVLFKAINESFVAYGYLYNILMFALIVFFTFFYTALVYNPLELAQNLKKNGGFIPGLRPGKQTADFFNYLLDRIGLVGAIYLGILAILPNIFGRIFMLSLDMRLSGTSFLIMVGVALEFAAQVEAYLIEHKYEGFLSVGRIKDRLLGQR